MSSDFLQTFWPRLMAGEPRALIWAAMGLFVLWNVLLGRTGRGGGDGTGGGFDSGDSDGGDCD